VAQREPQAAVDPLALDRAAARRADDRRGDGVQVLPAMVVEPVVVGPHERADRRGDRTCAVAERLVREHGGELHHADARMTRSVPPASQADGLVRISVHANVVPHPRAYVDPQHLKRSDTFI
jgi:hypothetical protein